MSADVLRRAAALMRERAEGAGLACWHTPADLLGMFDDPDDGDHIASWHPAVALAVADWLEQTADYAEAEGLAVLPDGAPLAVANAYLSEEA